MGLGYIPSSRVRVLSNVYKGPAKSRFPGFDHAYLRPGCQRRGFYMCHCCPQGHAGSRASSYLPVISLFGGPGSGSIIRVPNPLVPRFFVGLQVMLKPSNEDHLQVFVQAQVTGNLV